jgi:Ras and EF-hand domain-containing protein
MFCLSYSFTGVDFQMKTLIVDREQTVLQLWDTAGQERQVLFMMLLIA